MTKKHSRPKIGLALGGGGAKGLAHIGILKVLEKNKIPVDYIAGTSIGALVGGLYAASKSAAYVEDVALASSKQKFTSLMLELTSAGGLVGGEKVLQFLKEELDDADFSELRIPFVAVATELNCGEIKYFEKKGDVALAIRASISYPPVFAPVKIRDKMYVDGGLSCLVPAQKVRDMGADVVIAVDLERDYIFRKKEFDKASALGNAYRIFRFSIKALQKKLGEYDSKNADLVITPPVGKFKTWTDFDKTRQIIKIGEETAAKALKDIKRII